MSRPVNVLRNERYALKQKILEEFPHNYHVGLHQLRSFHETVMGEYSNHQACSTRYLYVYFCTHTLPLSVCLSVSPCYIDNNISDLSLFI